MRKEDSLLSFIYFDRVIYVLCVGLYVEVGDFCADDRADFGAISGDSFCPAGGSGFVYFYYWTDCGAG